MKYICAEHGFNTDTPNDYYRNNIRHTVKSAFKYRNNISNKHVRGDKNGKGWASHIFLIPTRK